MPHAHGKTLQGVVNVNTATPEQLELLPGIGQAKAQAIVERRQTKPFASLEDLAAVKGLGKKRREALRPHVTFSGPTTAQEVDAVQSAPAPDGKTGTP